MAADGAVLARTYRAYLFDLDGTLIDSAPDINGALNAALSSGGYPSVNEALTRHWVGHGSRVLTVGLQQADQPVDQVIPIPLFRRRERK